MRLVHTVLGNVNGRDEIDTIWQCISKSDGGIGLGLSAIIAHHYIKISAIYLINMVLL